MEANLDKGIDCTFESLGSSEGRHSSNENEVEDREISNIDLLHNEKLADELSMKNQNTIGSSR